MLFQEQEFKNKNYTSQPLTKGDYENCMFIECNFSNSDLSHLNFVECSFEDCDLTSANLNQTALKEVSFRNCKLLGLRFEHCNSFLMAVQFENCNLKLSSFYDLALKKTIFNNCDLGLVVFAQTVLEKADLRTAYNYNIDPELNRIRKARFSTSGLAGLLRRYDIDVE